MLRSSRQTNRRTTLTIAAAVAVTALVLYAAAYWWLLVSPSSSILLINPRQHVEAKYGRSEHLPTGPDFTGPGDVEFQQLLSLARERSSNSNNHTIVLLYCSFAYREQLFNWLLAYSRATTSAGRQAADDPLDGVVLVCLDRDLWAYLSLLGWACVLDETREQRARSEVGRGEYYNPHGYVWVKRMGHVTALLDHQISVLVSDLDAVWKRDIRPVVRGERGHIVASRGAFPDDNPWGATLCMGLVYFRATASSSALRTFMHHSSVKALVWNASDDQHGINRALYPLAFEAKTPQSHAFGSEDRLSIVSSAGDDATFRLGDDGEQQLHVTLLAHDVVARFCNRVKQPEAWSGVYVAHCLWVDDGAFPDGPTRETAAELRAGVMQRYGTMLIRPHLFNSTTTVPATFDTITPQERALLRSSTSISDFLQRIQR